MTAFLIGTVVLAGGTGRAAPGKAGTRWAGVWQGTIGKSEVLLCLQDDEDARGAYYYRTHLTLIALEVDQSASGAESVRLTESLPAGKGRARDGAAAQALWQVQASGDGKSLNGDWRDGRKVLPVNLAAVPWHATAENFTPCGSDAFNRLREQPGHVTTKDAVLHGVPYRVQSMDFGGRYEAEVVSFELLSDTAGVRRFNAAQQRAFREEERNVFDCSRGDVTSLGSGADYSSRRAPKIITEHWVVVEEDVDSSCGGAHPNSDTVTTTWRLDTGDKVDVWSWFLPTAATVKHHGQGRESYSSVVIHKPLRTLLRRGSPRPDDDCGDVAALADDWIAYPTDKGIGFLPTLPHAEQACANEIVVQWERVTPLLSKPGQEATVSFRAEVGKVAP